MATIERGGNEQVFQPVVMITKAIEILKWGLAVRLQCLGLAPIGVEVPQHRHRPESLLHRLFSAMKILHGVKDTVLIVHQSVYLITSAISLRQLKSQLEGFGAFL